MKPQILTSSFGIGRTAALLCAALAVSSLGTHEARAADAPALKSCVIIDNDFDIDDMMAIPLVFGSEHVAALIQSEGYTLPEESAPAVDVLVNGTDGSSGSRTIPIIVGGRQEKGPDLSQWPWLSFFRSMLNQANGLLPAPLPPWKSTPDYPQKLADTVADCDSVSILVIGTYTSFINYFPLLQDKVDRIVIMGQPINDDSSTPGRESFNCKFDFAACQKAMTLLEGKPAFFIDVPRFEECRGATATAAHCYSPDYAMVAGDGKTPGLKEEGMPGRLRKALLNDISCQSFYPPADRTKPCTSKSTWEPAAVAAGLGGEMLLWDQSAAIFLVHPKAFALFYPKDNKSEGGKHYSPVLIDNSDAKTVEGLRALWTDLTNAAVSIR